MKIKKDNGLVGVDMVVAVIAIIIFSTLIASLMYNNVIENVKLKKETLAMIYITETFENIGIQNYDNVTEENIKNLVPNEALDNYNVEFTVKNNLDEVTDNEYIIKKVTLKLSYEIANKTYSCSMERMKIKE